MILLDCRECGEEMQASDHRDDICEVCWDGNTVEKKTIPGSWYGWVSMRKKAWAEALEK